MKQRSEADVIIVGAGPVALFAVFELGLFDMKCHLIDVLDRPGGQCTELYPDKPIYDIPGWPSISAQELVEQLMKQIAPFKPAFSLGRMANAVEKRGDSGFRVTTDQGESIDGQIVVIAAGGGAFEPKRPPIRDIRNFEGESVFYSARNTDTFRGHDVLVLGGDEAAMEAVLQVHPVAKTVTLVHRRSVFDASSEYIGRIEALREAKQLDVRVGHVSAVNGQGSRLTSATIQGADGSVDVACTMMLPFFGVTTTPGALPEWGLGLQDDLIPVDTEKFQTAVPGIFAIGDVSTYPGKLRLILSGFHEAALMTQAARRIVTPGQRVNFQYTSSSTSLQKKLGLS